MLPAFLIPSRPITWWRHQMETISALLALCAGNSPVPGEFLAQRPVTRSFDVFLICARIGGWVNNVEAGDVGRQSAHYDVIVMNYGEVVMSVMTSHIAGVLAVCSTVCSKKTSKLRVTGLFEGNPPVTPSQRASNAENASIWWRHHVIPITLSHFVTISVWGQFCWHVLTLILSWICNHLPS